MKKITLSIFIFLFSVLISVPVFAQSNKDSGGVKRDEMMADKEDRKEDMMEAKEDRIDTKRLMVEEKKVETKAQRCERVQNRISQKYTNYGERKQNQATRYFNFVTKLKEVSEKLSAKGLDVSALDADIVELERLIAVYESSFDVFLASLGNMGNSCDADEDGTTYKGMLEETKDLLEASRNARKDIVEYYAQTVRKTIAELRTQAVAMLKEEKMDTDTEEVEEVTESEETNE
jgi:hypothetical protein